MQSGRRIAFAGLAGLVAAGLVGSGAPAQARPDPGDLYVQPTVRGRIGPAFALGDSRPPALSEAGGVSTGVELGGAIGWPGPGPIDRLFAGSLWLLPELGYSYRSDDSGAPGLHLGTLGLGVGYGNLLLGTFAYTPRLCVGAAAGETAVGLRHGVSGHFFGMLLSFELAHQLVRYTGGVLAHDLQLTFGANLGALFILLSPFR